MARLKVRSRKDGSAVPLDDADKRLLNLMQGRFPIEPRPYAAVARELGVEESDVLSRIRELLDDRIIRQVTPIFDTRALGYESMLVAAILYHRRAGFSANGMGVWKVPEGQELEYGRRMAAFRGISHCYQRPTYRDWPYSVFTMAHGRSKQECDAILDAIEAETGVTERATLYSSTEFKKVRLLYFTDDYKRWEAEHAAV